MLIVLDCLLFFLLAGFATFDLAGVPSAVNIKLSLFSQLPKSSCSVLGYLFAYSMVWGHFLEMVVVGSSSLMT